MVGQSSELHGLALALLVGKRRPTRDVEYQNIDGGQLAVGRHGPLENVKGTYLHAVDSTPWKLELDKSQASTAYTPTSTSLTPR